LIKKSLMNITGTQLRKYCPKLDLRKVSKLGTTKYSKNRRLGDFISNSWSWWP